MKSNLFIFCFLSVTPIFRCACKIISKMYPVQYNCGPGVQVYGPPASQVEHNPYIKVTGFLGDNLWVSVCLYWRILLTVGLIWFFFTSNILDNDHPRFSPLLVQQLVQLYKVVRFIYLLKLKISRTTGLIESTFIGRLYICPVMVRSIIV